MRLPVPERAELLEFADKERPLVRVFTHRLIALLGCVGVVLAVWAATTSPRLDAGQFGVDQGSVVPASNPGGGPDAFTPVTVELPAGDSSG